MIRLIGISFASVICAISLRAQGDAAYTRHDINGAEKFRYADITQVGNTETYMVSPTKKNPAYLINVNSLAIEATYPAGLYYIGARATSSPDGTYMLLRDLTIMEYKLKNRSMNATVIETATGKIMMDIKGVSDVEFHPDGERVVILNGDALEDAHIASGKRSKLMAVSDATNCIAVSPDGKTVAVTHAPDDVYLDEYLTKKGQRKNFKIYKKFRQCLSLYDYSTGKKIWTAGEMVDIPYVLTFGPGGSEVLVYSAPHDKLVYSTTQGSTDYITKINATNGDALSGGFISNSVTEPDFCLSHDEEFIAMVTINRNAFPEIWVYHYATAEIVARFECNKRTLGDELITEKTSDASRVGIAFTPDDAALLLTYGSILIKWTIPYE